MRPRALLALAFLGSLRAAAAFDPAPAPPSLAALPVPAVTYVYEARVVRVIDGDTIQVDLDANFGLTLNCRLRLLGLNCPEVHGESKAEGLKAKDYTADRLLGKSVLVSTRAADDFGRRLARVWVDGVDHNADLVAKGYAVPYRLEDLGGR